MSYDLFFDKLCGRRHYGPGKSYTTEELEALFRASCDPDVEDEYAERLRESLEACIPSPEDYLFLVD